MLLLKRYLTIILTINFILNSIIIVTANELNNDETFEDKIEPPEIVAPSAVVIDAKTGVIIYEKEKNQVNYPASITKIMTALLTLENANGNLNEKVKFSREAVYSIPYNSSHIAMNEDETLTVEQALYGIMLESANEVSNALAEHVSGTTEDFAIKMTQRANELGAVNTNFVNAHGLHDENHYTTAYDMALIMREAVKNEFFVKLISTLHYEIPPTEKQPEKRPLNNSNKMLYSVSQHYKEEVVGGKTGFTDEAKHTLVTYAKKDDLEIIVAVMKDEKTSAYTDTKALIDYSFAQFEDLKLFDKSTYSKYIPVTSSDGEQLASIKVIANSDISMILPVQAKNNIKITDNLPSKISYNVKEGDVLGVLKIECDGNTLETINLFAYNGFEIPSDTPLIESNTSSEEGINIIEQLMPFKKIIIASLIVIITLISLIAVCRAKRSYQRRTARYGLRRAKGTTYRYKNNY